MRCALKTVKPSEIVVACLLCSIFTANPCVGRTATGEPTSPVQDSDVAENPVTKDVQNDQPIAEEATAAPQEPVDNNDVQQRNGPETTAGPRTGQASPPPTLRHKIGSLYDKYGRSPPPPTGDENLTAGTDDVDEGKNNGVEQEPAADQDAEPAGDERGVRSLKRQNGSKNLADPNARDDGEEIAVDGTTENKADDEGKIDDPQTTEPTNVADDAQQPAEETAGDDQGLSKGAMSRRQRRRLKRKKRLEEQKKLDNAEPEADQQQDENMADGNNVVDDGSDVNPQNEMDAGDMTEKQDEPGNGETTGKKKGKDNSITRKKKK